MIPARLAPWAYVIGAPLSWVTLGGPSASYGWVWLLVLIAIGIPVVMLEVATLRKQGGFWGEKNDDGTPRYR